MRILPTAIHGVIDYLAGVVFIALPWILDWPNDVKALLTILGAGVIAYSLLTRYELGVTKVLAMKTHLILDALSGVILIAAPFVLDVDDDGVMWTLIALGVFDIGASLITETEPRGVDPTLTEAT